MCVTYVPGDCEDQKRPSDLPELQLQMVVGGHAGAGNYPKVLCMIADTLSPSHLPAPSDFLDSYFSVFLFGYHVAQAILKLPFSRPGLWSAEIRGVCFHAWLLFHFHLSNRICVCVYTPQFMCGGRRTTWERTLSPPQGFQGSPGCQAWGQQAPLNC